MVPVVDEVVVEREVFVLIGGRSVTMDVFEMAVVAENTKTHRSSAIAAAYIRRMRIPWIYQNINVAFWPAWRNEIAKKAPLRVTP